jgi:hypothetical protein
MAAPEVSGLAAILAGLGGSQKSGDIEWAMESTALDLGAGGRDDYYGYGLIQMDAAIRLRKPTHTHTTPKKSSNSGSPAITSAPAGSYGFSSATPTPTQTATVTITATPTQTPTAVTNSQSTPQVIGMISQPNSDTSSKIVPPRPAEGPIWPNYQGALAGAAFVLAGLLLLVYVIYCWTKRKNLREINGE